MRPTMGSTMGSAISPPMAASLVYESDSIANPEGSKEVITRQLPLDADVSATRQQQRHPYDVRKI